MKFVVFLILVLLFVIHGESSFEVGSPDTSELKDYCSGDGMDRDSRSLLLCKWKQEKSNSRETDKKRSSEIQKNFDGNFLSPEKYAQRQHWSFRYMPGGKRDSPISALQSPSSLLKLLSPTQLDRIKNLKFEKEKRQHWTDDLFPGGKKRQGTAETGGPSENKRQHWTFDLFPGGKK